VGEVSNAPEQNCSGAEIPSANRMRGGGLEPGRGFSGRRVPLSRIFQKNQEVQGKSERDFRIPLRPSFRSISPQKPKPFRSSKRGAVDDPDAGRADGAHDALKFCRPRFAPASPQLQADRRRAIRVRGERLRGLWRRSSSVIASTAPSNRTSCGTSGSRRAATKAKTTS
jgi:hypothetical protein